MRLGAPLPPITSALAGAALSIVLTVGGPAFAGDTSFEQQRDQVAEFKLQGGGASTLQSGRRITITRGVNLDNTDWAGENLKGVAFQQSVVRGSNFRGANLFTASFFDADLSNSNFAGANMEQVCPIAAAPRTDRRTPSTIHAHRRGR